MLKNKIIDFYDDTAGMLVHEALDKVASVEGIDHKEFIPSIGDLKSLDNSEFALIYKEASGDVLKKFPINSKASTALSIEYFNKTASALPDQARKLTENNLKIAATAFGVPFESKESGLFSNLYIETGKETFTDTQEKMASDSERAFALNGCMFPINDQFEINMADGYFTTYHQDMTKEDKTQFAQNLTKQASALNVEISDLVKIHANSDKFGSFVKEQLVKRANHFDERDEHREFLNKVASSYEKTTPEALKSVLSEFDKMTGLDAYYGVNGIKDAHSSVYEMKPEALKKVASPVWTSSLSDKKLTDAEIDKLASDKADVVKRYLGETFANALKKHPSDVFMSTPVDAQEVLAQIADGDIK